MQGYINLFIFFSHKNARNDSSLRAVLLFFLFEGCTLLCLHTLSCGSIKNYLTKTDALGSYLNKLLVCNELNSFLKGELNGRYKSKLFICA